MPSVQSSRNASSRSKPSSLKARTWAPFTRYVCSNPTCPVHHPKQSTNRDDAKWKAEQEKQRKEQAIANTVGLRVLSAIGSAVPVRLMKRDLLSVIERLLFLMDENRVEMLARQHGIRQKRDDGGVKKTIFKLDNGQIWQQTDYHYNYFYAYRPDVTIYQTSEGCRMKVEDEEETVLVKRIK